MLQRPPTLEDLIELVNSRAAGGNELSRLAEASALSAGLSSLTDRLLDHFVRQARDAGLSWSQIGQQLGVSKQGAQQRFTGQKAAEVPDQLRELGTGLEEKFASRNAGGSGGLLQRFRSTFKPQRFTPSARQVVIVAQEQAKELRHEAIDADHILLGLLSDENGLAASTLRSVGVTLDNLRSKISERVPPAANPPSGYIPLSTEAHSALECAMTESANLRHGYIGSEHVLLALLKEENTARHVLKELDIDVDHLIDEVSRLLERL